MEGEMVGLGVWAATSRSMMRSWSLGGLADDGGRGGGGREVPVAEARDAVGEFASGLECGIDDRFDVYVWEFVREESA